MTGIDFRADLPEMSSDAIITALRRARLSPEVVQGGDCVVARARCPVCKEWGLEVQADAEGSCLDCERCSGADGYKPDGYTEWRIWQALGYVGQEGWGEVIPLDPDPLPPMPVENLPTVLRDHVEAVAEAIQVPRDMVLLLDLGALAVACQGLARVHLGGDHYEEMSLYAMTVLPSGERKSAAAREAVGPIHKYERAWRTRVRAEVAAAQATRRALAKRQKRAESVLATADDDEKRVEAASVLAQVIEEIEQSDPGIDPRLLADDTTPEALARILAEHGRLGIVSAEGGIIDTLAGRYSDGLANLDAVLKAYDGEPYRVDRVGRDGLDLDRPHLTMALAVQPDVIEKAATNRTLVGRGLVPRFLVSAPRSMLGNRGLMPGVVPSEIRQAWHDTLTGLLDLGTTSVPFCAPASGESVIGLSPLALAEYLRFVQVIEEGLHPVNGRYAGISATAGKAAGLAGRIAGLLHLVEHGPAGLRGEIDEEAMIAAVEIVTVHLDHAARILHAGADSMTVRDARTIIDWAHANGLATFSARDALVGARKRSQGPDRMERIIPALKLLDERAWIRQGVTVGPFTGRPPSPVFEINPAVMP